jgi:hypothetical protein
LHRKSLPVILAGFPGIFRRVGIADAARENNGRTFNDSLRVGFPTQGETPSAPANCSRERRKQ